MKKEFIMSNVFCVLILTVLSSSVFSQKKHLISWRDSLTLNKDNFKRKRKGDNILAAVVTYFELKQYDLNNEFTVDAIAISNTQKNYFSKLYLKSDFRTDSLDKEVIRHENYHFNITEMYCRYIERDFYKFVKKKPRNIRRIHSKLSNLYWSYLSEWDAYEANFDNCTQHGNDVQEHEMWIDKINSELNNLQQFENVTIKLIKGKKKYSLVGLEKN